MERTAGFHGCVLPRTGISSDLLPIDVSKDFYFPVGPLKRCPYELEFPVLLLAHTPSSTKSGSSKHGVNYLFFHETKRGSSSVPSFYFCGHFNLNHYEVPFFKNPVRFLSLVPNHALLIPRCLNNGIAAIRNMED